MQAISDEMLLHGGTVASFDIEPFTQYGQHATESAFPHHASPLPVGISCPSFMSIYFPIPTCQNNMAAV